MPNADNTLKSGLFAEGELLATQETSKPALPAAMVTAVGGQAEVFRVVDGVARRLKVAVGPDQGGWRPLEGLPVGTRIIAQGRDLVADGSRLRILEPAAGTEGK